MEKGLIHIYCGDGKGKTTAAVGLAVRCAGDSGKVLFAQFLKDGTSGEISILKSIDGITLAPFYENAGFTFKMTAEEKKAAADFYTALLEQIKSTAQGYDMIVLDEVLHAVNAGLVPLDTLTGFIEARPDKTEIILTGRSPEPRLCALADYITEMHKIKHPFDSGIKARKKIEF